MCNIQERELNFMILKKYMFKTGWRFDVYKVICFKLGMMIDMTKLWNFNIYIPVSVTLTSTQGT